MDQVRYYEGDALRWGYNPTSVAIFNGTFGRDPESVPAPADPQWVAWRRDQVTALVRSIYTRAKALKPNVAVTAAVVTWGKGPRTADDWESQPAYASVLQDWRSWLRQGIVDYLLPMDYYREAGLQAGWFDTWTRWEVTNAGNRGVVLGLGTYLNSADGALAQLGRARAPSIRTPCPPRISRTPAPTSARLLPLSCARFLPGRHRCPIFPRHWWWRRRRRDDRRLGRHALGCLWLRARVRGRWLRTASPAGARPCRCAAATTVA